MIDENEIHDVDAFFAFQRQDNTKFWQRLGGRPSLKGLDVLDFGCGHGALALDCYEAGARSVLGIDLGEQRISYATEHVAKPSHGAMSFEVANVLDMPSEPRFDVIVSKDTFEHVRDIEDTLAALSGLLRPGGRLILGFSPLYYSPLGHHGELGSNLPWIHLIAGEKKMLAAFNRTNQTDYKSLPDAGFNMRPPRDFWHAFAALPVRTTYLKVNPAEAIVKKLFMTLFDGLRKVPVLERYFTVGIYVVLQKTGA